MREAGCKVNWICLADPWYLDPSADTPGEIRAATDKVLSVIIPAKPIAVVHHGFRTDRLYRAGKLDSVKTFLDQVHDLGFLAGVSVHRPAILEVIEEKSWPVDFYMASFYWLTRQPEDFEKEFGVVPVGKTFLSSDPPRMCKTVRQVEKPCLVYKILAAGRKCSSPEEVRQALSVCFPECDYQVSSAVATKSL